MSGLSTTNDSMFIGFRSLMKFDGVAESVAGYYAEIDYDNEHRCAEHEVQAGELPEPGIGDQLSALAERR